MKCRQIKPETRSKRRLHFTANTERLPEIMLSLDDALRLHLEL